MKVRILGLGGIVLCALVTACSSSTGTQVSSPMAENAGVPSGGGGGGESPGAAASSGDGSGSSSGGAAGGSTSVPASVLTAGVWDDNRNFDLFLKYRGEVAPALGGAPPFSEQEHKDASPIWLAPQPARQTLDVSFVIDTTGSMGDEMAYLSSEFLAMHTAIGQKYAAADQRWSLVVYRDVGDTYVVKTFDFGSDPNAFVNNLKAQSAGGGGDYPESPEQALAAAGQLGWRSGADTAKLAFWVTDAPHHDANAAAMAQAIRGLRTAGVHLYPIAASGADQLTHLTMREGAQLTGGRFMFLTNDSGIGDSHMEPLVPCYFVTKLDKAILRMVDIEMSGQYREPDAADLLRKGGDPQSGSCQLQGGGTASVF